MQSGQWGLRGSTITSRYGAWGDSSPAPQTGWGSGGQLFWLWMLCLTHSAQVWRREYRQRDGTKEPNQYLAAAQNHGQGQLRRIQTRGQAGLVRERAKHCPCQSKSHTCPHGKGVQLMMRPTGKIRSSPDCQARLHTSLASRETGYSGCTIFLVYPQEIITNLMTYSIYLIFLSSGGFKFQVKVFIGWVPLGGSEKHFIPYLSSWILEPAWQPLGPLTCGCTTAVYATLLISSSPLLVGTPDLILRFLPTSTNILFFNIYLFLVIQLQWVFFVACGIQSPEQGLNPGPLHWELNVLSTGPPGKSLQRFFYHVRLPFHVWGLGLGHICFWSHHSTYYSRYRIRNLGFLTSINSMIIDTRYFYLLLFGCARSQLQQERS